MTYEDLFYKFVKARHSIFEARLNDQPQPWTTDYILQARKFTNVFRLADRGSQFLINELLEPDISAKDILARCFLYRHTNHPDAWREMRRVLGRYPLAKDFKKDTIINILQAWRDSGERVFSGAYVVYPQSSIPGTDKIESVVNTTRSFLDNYAKMFIRSKTQEQRFEQLHNTRGVGIFMAMQILTDWGYSYQCGEDHENEFLIVGPGAIKGAKWVDPNLFALDVVRKTAEHLWGDLEAPALHNGRQLSIMDVQNCLCEFSKYMKIRSNQARFRLEGMYQPLGKQEPITIPEHLK